MFPPRVSSALLAGGKKMAEVQMCVLRGKGFARVQRSRDRDKIDRKLLRLLIDDNNNRSSKFEALYDFFFFLYSDYFSIFHSIHFNVRVSFVQQE